MKNRSEVEIMAAILKSAVSNWQYQTTIMQDAGVSHSQITRFLSKAIKNGLIDESEITRMYRTSQKGIVFLNKYSNLIELFPSVMDLPETKLSIDSKNLNVELNS
ncbi:MAG TPA: winged helix-turn-helix domain-containing protein [Nitrososphaeraceae archaeon]